MCVDMYARVTPLTQERTTQIMFWSMGYLFSNYFNYYYKIRWFCS